MTSVYRPPWLLSAKRRRSTFADFTIRVSSMADTLMDKAGFGETALWRGGVSGNYTALAVLAALSDIPTYPANLCPLFRRAEFACNCEDFGKAVGDAIKA